MRKSHELESFFLDGRTVSNFQQSVENSNARKFQCIQGSIATMRRLQVTLGEIGNSSDNDTTRSITSYLWHYITKLYARVRQASAWPWLLFLRWFVGKVPTVTNSSHGRDAPRMTRLAPLRLAMPQSVSRRRALGLWLASPSDPSDGPRAPSRP